MDLKNTFIQHLLVGIFSFALAFGFYGTGIRWSTSFARVSFILLFLTLIIGPITRLKKPSQNFSPLRVPWSWRGELGIWFTVTGLIHFYFVMGGRPNWNFMQAIGGGIGGGGYGLANLLGFIALFWSIILAVTSWGKIIRFLGISSWKWLHSFTYVVFYLVLTHLIYFQFFSTYSGGPDYFGYASLIMGLMIITLQAIAFFKEVAKTKKFSNKKN